MPRRTLPSRALALLIALTSLPGCQRETAASKADKTAPTPVDREAAKKALENMRVRQRVQVESFRTFKAKVDDLPDDLMGLVEFKESLGPVENVLGTATSQAQSLGDELEAALAGNDEKRLAFLYAQVTSTTRDLDVLAQKTLELAHQLAPFEDAASRQTSWTHKLPNGYELRAAPAGLESKLVAFVLPQKAAPNRADWIRFDRLRFVTITAELDQSRSAAQLENLTQILKAYPHVQLELGAMGVERQGSSIIQKRTGARVEALRDELVRRGIAPKRLSVAAEGPTCPLDAPERCVGSLAARPLQGGPKR